MRASFTGLVAGLLLALAYIGGGLNGLLIAILFGLVGLIIGAMASGESRSFRGYRRRRR